MNYLKFEKGVFVILLTSVLMLVLHVHGEGTTRLWELAFEEFLFRMNLLLISSIIWMIYFVFRMK